MATSTLGNGTLVLAGTTSGTTTVTATAVAGTTTLTLPAATDTLVGKATTDTLTNKTLTSPTISGVATFSAGTAALPAITTTGDTNTGIWFPAADTIAFTEGGVESMRLDSSGNLGLGVTPSAWGGTGARALQIGGVSSIFQVSNNTYWGNNFYYDGADKFYTSGYATRFIQNISTGVTNWQVSTASGTANAATTYNTLMTLDASGNLGIGTSSPAAKMQISAAEPKLRITSTAGSGKSWEISSGGGTTVNAGQFCIYDTTTDAQRFNVVSGTGNMTLDASGNLLVGTTSSATGNTSTFQSRSATSSDFGLAVTHTSTDDNVRALLVRSPNSSSDDGYLIIGARSTGDRFFVRTSGNVQNTNNSYGAISDVKLKENIVDATPKLEKLNQVRIVNYNLIGESHKQIGVIAQELEQVFPGMIDESPDKDAEGNDLGTTTKSVKYSVFVPMLIKAIQEQQALITQLTARITALESA